jgi:hypothetical protein
MPSTNDLGLNPQPSVAGSSSGEAHCAARPLFDERSRQRLGPRLRRLRLDEPLPPQLARLRRVTWFLTGLIGAIATFIFALFAAFGRPEIGALVSFLLGLPLIAMAWWDDRSLRRNLERYLELSGSR